MPFHILIAAPYFQPVIQQFHEIFHQHGIRYTVPPVDERFSEDQLLPLVPDIDGAICGDDAYTDRVLAHAPRLCVISKWGTGIDSIDRESCRRRGIAVCNTPNAFTEPVPNVLLAPHNSNSSPKAWQHVHHRTVQNLIDVLLKRA